MTAALAPLAPPAIPRRAIALSIAVHVAALLLLPGLGREAQRLELPPLIASLRLTAAPQPATTTVPAPAPAHDTPPPAHPSHPRPVHESHAAAPVATAPRSDAPPIPVPAPAPAAAAMQAVAAAPERPAREDAVAAAPSPRPAPAPAAPQENIVLDDYGRALSELLAHQQQYPRLAALRGWEGEVRLRLKVARKGSLVAVQVVHSSGHDVLDQHAVQLVQGAALPAPPDSLGDREIQVVVPIHYKLQKPT